MRTLVYGHRGNRAHASENTLLAIELAAEAGADGVELDVRFTADDRPVIFHDADLRRLFSDGRLVRETTFDELRDLRFPDDSTIPTLSECLQLCRDLKLQVILELKEKGAEQTVVDTVVRAGMTNPVVISSFDKNILLRLKERTSELIRAVVIGGRSAVQNWPALLLSPRMTSEHLGVDEVHVETVLLSRPSIRRLTDFGLSIAAWTVNDADLARQLAGLGVEKIITDDPGRIVAALRRRDE
jgi:glycerophosphoryl diester phosphodiesterase